MANAAPTPKAVALVLAPALVLMLAFAFFYVGAFHEPTPHHVAVAVVGPPAATVQLNRLPGDPLDARQASSPPRCAVADRRSRGLRRLRGRDEPPVRGVGCEPGDRRRAGSDVQPCRRCAAPASRARHRRQAAASHGPQRHLGLLRRDRVGVRRLHRCHAHRVDRQPTQQQQAARRSPDRGARGGLPSSPGFSASSCCARASGRSRATWSRCARSGR